MIIRVTKKIGKSELVFTVDKADQYAALEEAAFYACTPEKCSLCGSEDVELSGNRSKGYVFVKVRCLNPKCGATAQAGQYKGEAGGCFWKKFEIYRPSGDQSPVEQQETSKQPSAAADDVFD